ncbi:hypothetical protein NM688_g7129 [Phlebia brevispora]|uniref:Uncharacterized protein n=1 Tax=Phlebia brevispora TaxID=194682 RepID=A0ACC1S911_9APHY|nr:hypothetical protein NM688_g7129 [Phlebia brevispora]
MTDPNQQAKIDILPALCDLAKPLHVLPTDPEMLASERHHAFDSRPDDNQRGTLVEVRFHTGLFLHWPWCALFPHKSEQVKKWESSSSVAVVCVRHPHEVRFAMAVITPRDDSTRHNVGSSHKVAVATIVGMVLGILCLFGMILAYQVLLPSKRTPSRGPRALAPPTPKRLPFLTRIRAHCTTFLTSLYSRFHSKPSDTGESSSGRRRMLRSFHLGNPERARQREKMRHRFASALRLNFNFVSHSDGASRRTYKGFSPLVDDVEECKFLMRPDSAVISPWSPFEDCLSPEQISGMRPLFLDSALPSTPSPLSPLPPAYLQSTPIRSRFRQMSDAGDDSPRRNVSSTPTSPTLVDEELDIVDCKTLMEEVEQVLEYTRNWSEEDEQSCTFVVGEDDEVSDEL